MSKVQNVNRSVYRMEGVFSANRISVWVSVIVSKKKKSKSFCCMEAGGDGVLGFGRDEFALSGRRIGCM